MEHWHVDPATDLMDTFHALTTQIDDTPLGFFRLFVPEVQTAESTYREQWDVLEDKTRKAHQNFLTQLPFSDFYAYKEVMKAMPAGTFLQMGNSAAVRYVQLLTQRFDIVYHGNRGTSGIDGCTSTAAGAAYLNDTAFTCLVTGDVSFFYDVNGLWHQYLSPKLRIIIVNNAGGGIFRIIKGPSSTNQLEKFFESRHSTRAKNVAITYGLGISLRRRNETEVRSSSS